jgi:hypothetical protein
MAPSLHLFFAEERVIDSLVFLTVDQPYGKPFLGVVGSFAGLMLVEPALQILCAACVKGTVSALEDVEVCHRSLRQAQ